MPRDSEQGLTLTELTIVMVLASIVMLGIVGFYVSSQGTWMDASAQAITQREASGLIENIADSVHVSGDAIVTVLSPDGLQTQLELFENAATVANYVFWWNPTDSLIHEGPSRSTDRGAAITSKVEQFQCVRNGPLVEVTLTLRSPEGQRVQISSAAVLLNRDNLAGP